MLVSGAVAVKGEGGAREGAVCSEEAPPTAPDEGPSTEEKTPVEEAEEKHFQSQVYSPRCDQSLSVRSSTSG